MRRGDIQALLYAANDRRNLHARLHGLWGIAQLARRDARHASLLPAFLTDGDAEIRAQAARLVGDIRYAEAAAQVLPLLKDREPRVRYFATEALGRLAHRPATSPIVAMLADNDGRDMYLQHGAATALAAIGDAAALEALSTHVTTGVRSAAVVALRRLKHPGVAHFLADEDEAVATDAARAINDDGGIPEATRRLAAALSAAKASNEPLVRRAINANVRLGTAEAVARLEAFASDARQPSELRVEAVAALGVWDAPSPMDRVDGIYHGDVTVTGNRQPATGDRATTPRQAVHARQAAGQRPAPPSSNRDAAAARAAVERLVQQAAAVTPADADMKVAAAEAAGRLGAQGAAPVLQTQLRSDPSVLVRTAALRGLQEMKVGDMSALMQTALADTDATVRRAALAILPSLPITPAAKVRHLQGVLDSGAQAEQQGALEVLGTMKSAQSRGLLARYLDDLDAGRLEPALQIDLVRAVQADGAPALQSRLEAYQRRKRADGLIMAFREAALTGGDARKGQQVLFQNPLAECTRCHAIRGRGSDVGPDLTRIGRLLTREQLFEALVAPNERIAPGYGTVGITLKDGERIDGTLREETDDEVIVVAGTPAEPRRIRKSDIAERTDPVSAMPPLGLLLSPGDVRDLIEFLSALR